MTRNSQYSNRIFAYRVPTMMGCLRRKLNNRIQPDENEQKNGECPIARHIVFIPS